MGFPLEKPFQGKNKGNVDVFVSKLSPSGNSLLYSTFLGGGRSDHGKSIAVDSSGSAYVTGYTLSVDFPLEKPFQETNRGSRDVFVSKLSPEGNSLLFSTYLGGGRDDYGDSIAINSKGSMFVTGWTHSGLFPMKNAYQNTFNSRPEYTDVFVTKIAPEKSSLVYSTYFGDRIIDRGSGIAVENGYAYVTGTAGWGFPTKNAFQENHRGGYDAFVTKILDDLPPTVSITSPDDGAVVGGTVVIRAKASDDVGIDRVDFYIGDQLLHSDNQAPYKYEWRSFAFENGTYTIKAEAVDSEAHKSSTEITVNTQNVILSLDVEIKQDQAWLVKRSYGKIDLSVTNPMNLVVAKYIVYRKDSGGEYLTVKEIPGAEVSGGSCSFNDTYLEKDKTYIYKAEAIDDSGNVIGTSEEQSTQKKRKITKIRIQSVKQ
jgi:hypothetical protein